MEQINNIDWNNPVPLKTKRLTMTKKEPSVDSESGRSANNDENFLISGIVNQNHIKEEFLDSHDFPPPIVSKYTNIIPHSGILERFIL